MRTQQLFQKYILLSELKKRKAEEYKTITAQLNKLIGEIVSAEENRTLKKLDEINSKRADATLKQIELSQTTGQVEDARNALIQLLEGMTDIPLKAL